MMREEISASGLTPDECRIRAAFYRHMAKSAMGEDVSEGLILLAEKYERRAQCIDDQCPPTASSDSVHASSSSPSD